MTHAPAGAEKSINFVTERSKNRNYGVYYYEGEYMKKLIFILMTIFFVFAITGCPPDDDEEKDDPKVYPTRKFWAQTMGINPPQYYLVDAEQLAENSRCIIWAEKGSGVTEATATNMANAYNTVYTKMMKYFGWETIDPDLGKVDVMQVAHWIATGTTSNAKLTILLLNIKDNYDGVKNISYFGGYFASMNLIKNDPKHPQLKYSNELDMIYVDTYPSVPGDPQSCATLAHEMQHLMNYVSSVAFRFDGENLNFMNTWIDEGLANAAEWVYLGTHPEGRWKYYIQDKSGLIKKGNNFFIWGNRDSESNYANLDDYATVYLFFQWLRLQSSDPDNMYSNIILSEFSDFHAVTEAAGGIDETGSRNSKKGIDAIYYDNWPLLLRDWFAANYTNSPTSRYGYKNEKDLNTVKAPMFPGGTTSVTLYPGEGVYSQIQIAETLPSASGNIKYAGLGSRSSSTIPDDTKGFANSARLTYNIDTDIIKSSSANGSTTGVAPPSADISISSGNASLQIGSGEFSGPYMVDASFSFWEKETGSISDNGTRGVLSINNGENDGKTNILKIDRSKIRRVVINE